MRPFSGFGPKASPTGRIVQSLAAGCLATGRRIVVGRAGCLAAGRRIAVGCAGSLAAIRRGAVGKTSSFAARCFAATAQVRPGETARIAAA